MTFSLRGPGGPLKVILRTTHAFPTTCAILKSYMSLKNPLNPYCHLMFQRPNHETLPSTPISIYEDAVPYTQTIHPLYRTHHETLHTQAPFLPNVWSFRQAFSFQLRRIVNRSQRKLPSALEYERCHPNRRCCGHVLVVSFTPVTAPSLLGCTIRESVARFAMRCVCTLNACLSPFHVPIFSRRCGECVSVYSSALLSQAAPRVVSHVSSRLCYA